MTLTTKCRVCGLVFETNIEEYIETENCPKHYAEVQEDLSE